MPRFEGSGKTAQYRRAQLALERIAAGVWPVLVRHDGAEHELCEIRRKHPSEAVAVAAQHARHMVEHGAWPEGRYTVEVEGTQARVEVHLHGPEAA